MKKGLILGIGGAGAAAVLAVPLAIAVVVGGALGGSSGSSCTVVGSSSNAIVQAQTQSASPVAGPIDITLPKAVQAQVGGNLQLSASMDYGSRIESSWNPYADNKDGGYGYYRIQKVPDEHPTISIQQTEDPNLSTAFMLGAYKAALDRLNKESPGAWTTNAMLAADKVAFYAEKPAVDYTVNRESQVPIAWSITVHAMEQLGQIKSETDLGAASAAGSNSNSVNGCTSDQLNLVAATSNSAQLAQQLLAQWGGKLTGNPGVFQDLMATSQAKTITNSDTCGNTISLDPRVLQVLLNLLQRYTLFMDNIVTGHGCDQYFHPKGKAFDVGGATDLQSGVHTSFCSGPFPAGSSCNTSTDNQALDRQFLMYLSLLLPQDAGLGQSECYGRIGTPMASGINFFNDTCTHQHMQIQTRS